MPGVDDSQWMHVAVDLAARAASLGEVPVGAVVVKGDQIIGQGWNCPISSCDPSAHAEIMALRSAAQHLNNYRLPACTLYVTIEPCAMCAGAVIHSRIKRVVFGALEPKAGAVVSNLKLFDRDFANHKVIYQAGVCAEQCSEMMGAFFQQRREVAKERKKLQRGQRQV